MYIDEKEINLFFQMLNDADIQYTLIKNVGNELPSALEDGKDIDILVNENDKSRFESLMVTGGYERVIHPLGADNGWNFGYQLPACQFWKKDTTNYNLFIDVNFKLCCKSLMPKIWIPLDMSINDCIWKNRKFDTKNNWWIMDDDNVFVYLIVRSIFDKRNFKKVYIDEIESQISLLEKAEVKDKLSKVFFKYTPYLVQMIKDSRYDEIIDDYISFAEY